MKNLMKQKNGGGKVRGLFGRFKKDADGSASIEFCLWMPVFMMLMMLSIDGSLLFMNQSNYWSVSRDTARLVARHAITAEEAEQYAQQKTVSMRGTPSTRVVSDGNTVTVTLTAPAPSLTAFNVFGFASPYTVTATTVQAVEPI